MDASKRTSRTHLNKFLSHLNASVDSVSHPNKQYNKYIIPVDKYIYLNGSMDEINISFNSDEIIDSSLIQKSKNNSNKRKRILTVNFCGTS